MSQTSLLSEHRKQNIEWLEEEQAREIKVRFPGSMAVLIAREELEKKLEVIKTADTTPEYLLQSSD